MKKEDAIELMKTATNIDDWNAKRKQIQDATGKASDIVLYIDQSGLITEVLGRDFHPSPTS